MPLLQRLEAFGEGVVSRLAQVLASRAVSFSSTSPTPTVFGTIFSNTALLMMASTFDMAGYAGRRQRESPDGSDQRPSCYRPVVVALSILEPVAKADAPILRNLFELYAHDFSEHVPLELKASGRFEVDPGGRWWTDDAHFPYFIRCNGGRLAGFALVRRGSRITGASDVMDVAEFFVVRGERRKGIGVVTAHALFDAFPGPWEIRVRHANTPAMSFWSRAVGARVEGQVARTRVTLDGVDWDVLGFESESTAPSR